MRRYLAALTVVVSVSPALALDMPPRKAGLWELTMKFESRNIPGQTMKHCIDAATDRLMSANTGGGLPQQNCDKQDVTHAGGMTIVDSVCHYGGATTTSHAEITGDFNSAYTMQVTTKRQGAPAPGMPASGETRMTIAAKWLGPCGAGQRPGDIIMSNGMKMNVLDMRGAGGVPRVPPQR